MRLLAIVTLLSLAVAAPALAAMIAPPPSLGAEACAPFPDCASLPPAMLDETGAVRMNVVAAPALEAGITALPPLEVASLPSVHVGSLPALQVGSVPPLDVASLPALTIASMPPQTFQAEFPGAMNVTLVNPVLNIQGKLELVEPPPPVPAKVFEGKVLRNYTARHAEAFNDTASLLAHFGIGIDAADFSECVVRAIVLYSGSPGGGNLTLLRTIGFNNPGISSGSLSVSRLLLDLPSTLRYVTDVTLTAEDASFQASERADTLQWTMSHNGSSPTMVDYRPTCYRLP